ncbi:hypothetical protein FQV26_00735 [Planococcus sp. CPCC 101016]|uniref:DUF6176 family protein n=1 Tax=Planococcus sp. CPCC 101016 TaxID=2599617 RepID=UPI0011B7945A|nr:DUF6176 family protein [Planococcus sp. CPCC 101016]TWT08517.1 hypothetical protein FQV26_00735 [Planococcus sp. CPCC 101016]
MTAELSKFKVKEGKAEVVDQWMAFLNEHMDSVLLTLEDEKMFVETIFKEEIEGAAYLYWYSVQGEGGSELENSDHEVDKKHMEFWNECIDFNYPSTDMDAQVVMIQKKIRTVMT